MRYNKRRSLLYDEFRAKVLRRDNYRCQMPGCSKNTRLQVHHIKRYADAHYLRFDASNGITLCYTCHQSIKNKERHFEQLFRDILSGFYRN